MRLRNLGCRRESGTAAKSSIAAVPVGQNAVKAQRIRPLTMLEPLVPQRHITKAAWNRSGRRIGAP